MHFHLPKPLHGWREFAGEVGIIVIGVLIALAAEQVVQKVHDRRVARETRALVKEELETNLALLLLRSSAEPCIATRLSEIRSIFQQWARTGTFQTPTWVAQVPRAEADFPRFDAALSGGRIALLPDEQQYQLGSVVAELRRFNDVQTREIEAWAKLRALQLGPEALSATDRTMILDALQEASTLDYLARLEESQVLPSAARQGYHPNMRRFHEWVRSVWSTGRYSPAICVNINTPSVQANRQAGLVVPLPL